jgi:hypothetical protein
LTTAEPAVPNAVERTNQLRFRWPASVRLLAAAAIAGLVTLAIALSLPRQLKVSTDVVGYPIFANFNVERLINIYYLGVFFFPIAALVLYLGQTWLARRLGLAEPESDRVAAEVEMPVDDERVMQVGLSRALTVGAAFGLEASILASATGLYFWIALVAVAVAYTALLFGVAQILHRFHNTRGEVATAMARVNALAAPLVLLGLWALSEVSAVTILSNGSVRHYPWMPWWLAIALAGAAFAWIWYRLSAAPNEAAIRAIERKTVLFLTATVVLFVLLSELPGDPGRMDVFHDGEGLVAARLTTAGAFYWRDLLSIHGFLQDVIHPLIGLRVFEDSRWGYWAGNGVLINPITYATFFVFGAWLFERTWAFVAALLVAILSRQFITLDARFAFWPLILLLLGIALQRRSKWLMALVGVSLTAQAILVPESAYCVPAVGLIVILYDLSHRQPRTSILATFTQTLWLAGGGIVLFAVFALYLVSQHALSDFIFYYLVFVPGHELTGALPIHLRQFGLLFVFFVFAPPVAYLLGSLYYAAKVIRRQPLTVRDWVVGASAIFAIPYYTKYLERADLGHGEQAYGAAVPLIAYLIYRGCVSIEAAIRKSTWWPRSGALMIRQPVAILLLVGAIASVMVVNGYHTAIPIQDWLAATPTRYRPAVTAPPTLAGVGYSDTAIDTATVTDMQKVFNAYLGPGDWVFDFSNEPALTYYLLGQTPHVRYYHASMTIAERAQKDLISELEQHPPKLVVFNSLNLGLLNWDGIPNQVRHYEVSHYLLDNYTPLLDTHTQLIYGLKSAQLSPALVANLSLSQPVQTQNLDFAGFPCDWGYSPNFLSISPPPSQRQVSPVSLTPQPSPDGLITFTGWAGDGKTGQAASQVVLTIGDKVVETMTPTINRPDVAVAYGQPGLALSGYRLTARVSDAFLLDPNAMQLLRLYAVSAGGVATEILGSPGAAAPLPAKITLTDGTTDPVRGEGVGKIDIITPYHQLIITPPSGSSWADYRWLEIDTSTRFANEGWALYDGQTGDLGHQISFQTLGNSATTLRVFVGSCAQWYGFGSVPVFLGHRVTEDISAVRLLP